MAQLTVRVPLDDTHASTDRLQLRVGSGDRLTLAQSTPVGGRLLLDEAIGSAADLAGGEVRELTVDHLPPGGDAVLAVGVAVADAVGNVSPLYETFARLTDHPDGVDTRPVETTGLPNQALLTWTPSPQTESV